MCREVLEEELDILFENQKEKDGVRVSKKWSFVLLTLALICLMFSSVVNAEVRRGAWVDEIIFVAEPNAPTGLSRLQVGELDLYSDGISDPQLFQRILENPNLGYEMAFGLYDEITFNPYGPEFEDGRLNPFSVPRIREAMNWLIDREYVAQEIYGGMANARYFPITGAFPDYARIPDVVRTLELEYKVDPARANAVITEEMQKLGAQKVGGVWQYKGAPVTLIVLIRTEDERTEVGDYVATLLEEIGFRTERLYRTGAEASPIWISGNPALGGFHVYTGAWITTVVARDQGSNFEFFYTPLGLPFPLWQAYQPTEEFDDLAQSLTRQEFTTMEQRNAMFARAMKLSLEDSVRIFLVDRISVFPRRAELSVAADLAGGTTGAYLWPTTIRRDGQVGGKITIGLTNVLVEPWNPLDGSNWSFDTMPIRGTADYGYQWDPFTGLQYPQRFERADVYIKEGLPVSKTLDWVNLQFVEENVVPMDAWSDWDAKEHRFLTVGETHPEGRTSNRKTVVYYPADLYDTVVWHDGSPFSVGDVILGIILSFDRGNVDSEVYDEAKKSGLDSWMQTLKGIRITSVNPLVIEYYIDTFYLDAEWYVGTWWPAYSQGPGAWHNLALGLMAEKNEELAFSADKADRIDVEWTNYVAGPSLDILAKYLRTPHLPYEAVMAQFVSAEEMNLRFANLQKWYAQKGHFWLGTGPFYLEKAYPVERMVHLKRFEQFPDPSDKWTIFSSPMIAEVDVDGAARVTIGKEFSFDVWITFEGADYPLDYIQVVKYLLFDASGNLVYTGDAIPVEDGLYSVVISSELSASLPVGGSKIEIVVAPLVVSIPTFETFEFIMMP